MAGQLTSADHTVGTDEVFNYDDAGNRTGASIVVGDGNRIASDGQFSYTYDDEGNLTTKTNISTGAFTRYAYDHRNRLTQADDFGSGGRTAGPGPLHV